MSASVSAVRDSLMSAGYVEIPEWGDLKPGATVCNRSEQFWRARENGTATVVHVLRNEGSNWERSYRRPDVEVVVLHEDGSARTWADYGTELARRQPRITSTVEPKGTGS